MSNMWQAMYCEKRLSSKSLETNQNRLAGINSKNQMDSLLLFGSSELEKISNSDTKQYLQIKKFIFTNIAQVKNEER